MEPGRGVALALIGLGVLFVSVVFALAVQYLGEYSSITVEGDLEAAISQSAGVLLEVLVRVAFLGVALAAGSVLLSKGVALLRGGREEGRGAG